MSENSNESRPSEYIKTLLALTSLTIAGAFFSLLRSPKAFTYLTIGFWLVLNFKFGYKQWMIAEEDCRGEMLRLEFLSQGLVDSVDYLPGNQGMYVRMTVIQLTHNHGHSDCVDLKVR